MKVIEYKRYEKKKGIIKEKWKVRNIKGIKVKSRTLTHSSCLNVTERWEGYETLFDPPGFEGTLS
jgi:hypothetical protein